MGNPVSFRPPSSGGAEYCENCGWGTTPPPPTPGTPTSQRGPFSLFTTYKAVNRIRFSLLVLVRKQPDGRQSRGNLR